MYRGQDIGDKAALVRKCLAAIRGGNPEQIRSLLPHISVVRSPELNAPLIQLLSKGNTRQKELAAIALGTLGDPEAVPVLFKVYKSLQNRRGQGCDALRVALILALGEICHDDSVQALLGLYQLKDSVFQAQRQQLILASLGLLAQHGCGRAEEELTRLLGENDEATRVDAISELAVAYWHRPNQIPESLVLKMAGLAREGRGQIRQAAFNSLRSLADLGCRLAEEFFEELAAQRR